MTKTVQELAKEVAKLNKELNRQGNDQTKLDKELSKLIKKHRGIQDVVRVTREGAQLDRGALAKFLNASTGSFLHFLNWRNPTIHAFIEACLPDMSDAEKAHYHPQPIAPPDIPMAGGVSSVPSMMRMESTVKRTSGNDVMRIPPNSSVAFMLQPLNTTDASGRLMKTVAYSEQNGIGWSTTNWLDSDISIRPESASTYARLVAGHMSIVVDDESVTATGDLVAGQVDQTHTTTLDNLKTQLLDPILSGASFGTNAALQYNPYTKKRMYVEQSTKAKLEDVHGKTSPDAGVCVRMPTWDSVFRTYTSPTSLELAVTPSAVPFILVNNTTSDPTTLTIRWGATYELLNSVGHESNVPAPFVDLRGSDDARQMSFFLVPTITSPHSFWSGLKKGFGSIFNTAADAVKTIGSPLVKVATPLVSNLAKSAGVPAPLVDGIVGAIT